MIWLLLLYQQAAIIRTFWPLTVLALGGGDWPIDYYIILVIAVWWLINDDSNVLACAGDSCGVLNSNVQTGLQLIADYSDNGNDANDQAMVLALKMDDQSATIPTNHQTMIWPF